MSRFSAGTQMKQVNKEKFKLWFSWLVWVKTSTYQYKNPFNCISSAHTKRGLQTPAIWKKCICYFLLFISFSLSKEDNVLININTLWTKSRRYCLPLTVLSGQLGFSYEKLLGVHSDAAGVSSEDTAAPQRCSTRLMWDCAVWGCNFMAAILIIFSHLESLCSPVISWPVWTG